MGLTPQSIHQIGGFRKQARDADEARENCSKAPNALQAAGAFALVLEMIPDKVAADVTQSLEIPTIGIGAGPYCDGQVLVSHRCVSGSTMNFTPRFVKRFAELGRQLESAAEDYVREVRQGEFPVSEKKVLSGHYSD